MLCGASNYHQTFVVAFFKRIKIFNHFNDIWSEDRISKNRKSHFAKDQNYYKIGSKIGKAPSGP